MKAFKAKFPGECIVCGTKIKIGQRIRHDGGGYRHTDCETVAWLDARQDEFAEQDAVVAMMAQPDALKPVAILKPLIRPDFDPLCCCGSCMAG